MGARTLCTNAQLQASQCSPGCAAFCSTGCGITGMLVTVAAAFASDYVQGEAYWLIPACIVPCALFGVWYANSVVTDRLPELVGLFNSFGGLAAALEGIAVYTDRTAVLSMYSGAPLDRTEQKVQLVVLYLSIIIGMATFTGSVIAVLKLTAAWPKRSKARQVDMCLASQSAGKWLSTSEIKPSGSSRSGKIGWYLTVKKVPEPCSRAALVAVALSVRTRTAGTGSRARSASSRMSCKRRTRRPASSM